ncbi:MAG: nucleotide exchange factor GrpE [Bacteroidota bacterium]|nr:nucleotide exchange factor GrpE [Bacteroidota bacterium]
MRNPFRRSGKEKKTMNNENVKPEGINENENTQTQEPESTDTTASATETPADERSMLEAELDLLRTEHQALHDKHLRLYAEFDNFRKRTAKERLELLQFAGENTIQAVLPVLDDLNRAITNNENVEDISAVRDGVKLIHQKLHHILSSQGLKQINVKKGDPFDTDKHEAITKAPAQEEKLKGAVIDVVENGYTLHEKMIRYAKVVVGE